MQAEQSRYQPIPEETRPAPFAPWDPNFRQLSRVMNSAPRPMSNSFAPSAEAPVPPPRSVQYEADQAQQAREAAAARLGRGIRSPARAEAPPPDPVDIAKSAGIGLANGTINTAGLVLGDIPTGFGYLPNNLLLNGMKRLTGYPEIPADEPDWNAHTGCYPTGYREAQPFW